jgi:hypothetical protein
MVNVNDSESGADAVVGCVWIPLERSNCCNRLDVDAEEEADAGMGGGGGMVEVVVVVDANGWGGGMRSKSNSYTPSGNPCC